MGNVRSTHQDLGQTQMYEDQEKKAITDSLNNLIKKHKTLFYEAVRKQIKTHYSKIQFHTADSCFQVKPTPLSTDELKNLHIDLSIYFKYKIPLNNICSNLNNFKVKKKHNKICLTAPKI